jgi:hypothetical protein
VRVHGDSASFPRRRESSLLMGGSDTELGDDAKAVDFTCAEAMGESPWNRWIPAFAGMTDKWVALARE